MDHVKLVAVGDGAVGKTCLLMVYVDGKFPGEYIPTVFDNYRANVAFNHKQLTYDLWDTAGQEDYEKMRPLSYKNTHVFLVCFSVMKNYSLGNVQKKWLPELQKLAPGVPIVLVGTQTDLRGKAGVDQSAAVTPEAGRAVADAIGAAAYMECSALENVGVQETFSKAIEVVFAKRKPPPKSSCCLLM